MINPLVMSGIVSSVLPSLVNIIKKPKFIGNKGAPLVALGLGLLYGTSLYYFGNSTDLSLIDCLLLGAGTGGSSTGLYDLQKKLRGK